MLSSVTVPLFAESAPVYDADSMPQQFDGDSDQAQQQDVPPPPPSSDGGGAFVPAQSSATPSSAPASSYPIGMDQRLKRLEQQVNNMQGGEGTARIDSLQDQIQALRGQVEQLTHQLQLMQSQQKTMYTDLDKRLSQAGDKPSKKISAGVTDTSSANDDAAATSTTPAAKIATAKQTVKATAGVDSTKLAADTSTAKKSAADQPNVAEEQQIYQTAYNLIKAKKYNDAVEALQGMLKKYPSGQFASNAHYWLGELYGLMGKNDLALNEFGTVVETYPESPRVSDAQLKVGLIYSAQSKWSDAKSSFKKVINHYPGTASARVASEQLKQIKMAGH
jgi:tol-pal system protein YbgF